MGKTTTTTTIKKTKKKKNHPMDKYTRFEAWLRENGARFEQLELCEYDTGGETSRACISSYNTDRQKEKMIASSSSSSLSSSPRRSMEGGGGEEKKEMTTSMDDDDDDDEAIGTDDDDDDEEEESEMRGIHARHHIPPNTICMSIPRRCLITVEMGQATSIGQAIYQSDLDLDAPKHIYLMIYILWDMKVQGSLSFFAPYYATLPKTLHNMPIFWTQTELDELQGSYLLHQIADRNHAIAEDYHTICSVAPSLQSICTLEEFKWARMCVCSRNFGLQIDGHRTSALVPHADMLNHYRPRETKWTFDEEMNAFTITTLQHIAANAQVYDSYGQKCNHRFLLNYGFAVEENRELDGFCPNEVPLELLVNVNDVNYQEKMEFWTRGEVGYHSHHHSHQHQHHSQHHHPPPPTPSLSSSSSSSSYSMAAALAHSGMLPNPLLTTQQQQQQQTQQQQQQSTLSRPSEQHPQVPRIRNGHGGGGGGGGAHTGRPTGRKFSSSSSSSKVSASSVHHLHFLHQQEQQQEQQKPQQGHTTSVAATTQQRQQQSPSTLKRVRVCVSNNENTRLLFSFLRALACNEAELRAIRTPLSSAASLAFHHQQQQQQQQQQSNNNNDSDNPNNGPSNEAMSSSSSSSTSRASSLFGFPTSTAPPPQQQQQQQHHHAYPHHPFLYHHHQQQQNIQYQYSHVLTGIPSPSSSSSSSSSSFFRSCRDIRHPISLRNERAALQLLLDFIGQHLARYPTTLSQDVMDLNNEQEYPRFSNRRHAKIQVKGEKEVLHHFSFWAKTGLHVLQVMEEDLATLEHSWTEEEQQQQEQQQGSTTQQQRQQDGLLSQSSLSSTGVEVKLTRAGQTIMEESTSSYYSSSYYPSSYSTSSSSPQQQQQQRSGMAFGPSSSSSSSFWSSWSNINTITSTPNFDSLIQQMEDASNQSYNSASLSYGVSWNHANIHPSPPSHNNNTKYTHTTKGTRHTMTVNKEEDDDDDDDMSMGYHNNNNNNELHHTILRYCADVLGSLLREEIRNLKQRLRWRRATVAASASSSSTTAEGGSVSYTPPNKNNKNKNNNNSHGMVRNIRAFSSSSSSPTSSSSSSRGSNNLASLSSMGRGRGRGKGPSQQQGGGRGTIRDSRFANGRN